MNILMLEDEPLILMDLEFAAEDEGCRALCASSVSEAMAILDSERIDSAILDVTLKDGETCVPVARALDERGIPYLLHSGDLDRHDETVRALGAELVAKPASAATVIARAIKYARDAHRQTANG
ncbi:DNA-binding response OmpR family regulator [Novosphingobium chloroacetimidivorans]|uniref:DNA-binding response OmpR family regulator n=1 Tax=Novosphingobium chloroacetimidivorans TaxID=1428314 RepID=A0A7W7K777_9SPHN|nr:response regulator [Novosphingobium chloroacetimidivorans]MBB4857500.1 DNA-binding response OmpR family regulator [Novosphingobium chloroacetimidivorans]